MGWCRAWSIYTFVCLCWGFMAQSTQWGDVEHGQFTHLFVCVEVLWPSQHNGVMSSMVNLHICLFVLRFYGPVNTMGWCRAWSIYTFVCLCWGFMAQSTQWGDVEHGQFTHLFVCVEVLRPSQHNGVMSSMVNLHICLFVLRFYGPVNPMGSCQARSVYLTTRLLGRLSPLSG